MLRCSKCSYAWNPDTATTCVQCKSLLTAGDGAAAASRTPEVVRRQTIAEGVSTDGFGASLRPAPNSASNVASSPVASPGSSPAISSWPKPASSFGPTPPPPVPLAKAPAVAAWPAVEATGAKPPSAPVVPPPAWHEADLYRPGISAPVDSSLQESGSGHAELPGAPGARGSQSGPEAQPPRWGDQISAERAERKRTVFAGASTSAEIPPRSNSTLGSGSQPNPQAAPFNSGQRRPQTLSVDPNRKIVGVLITYSWVETGQIFPILEGRNLIGKDAEQCDICIPQDATLSAVNSFITFRRTFIIGDKVSMSGTDVDGEPVESQFIPLKNYAQIRTGSTQWTFVAMQPTIPQPAEFTTAEKFTTGEM